MPQWFPARTKYRKRQRKSMKGLKVKESLLAFGEYGLVALEPAWIDSKQLETVRLTLSRKLPKSGKFWIRIFPDMPITKKPQGSRMGKGKGEVEGWAAVVKRGKVILEISGVEKEEAQRILRVVQDKLPIQLKFVERI